MDNLHDLGFIFAIIFGFISLPFFRKFLFLGMGVGSQGQDGNSNLIFTIIVSGIVFFACVFSLGFFFAGFLFDSDYIYIIKEFNDIFRYLLFFASVLVDFFIGTLIGCFLKSLHDYLLLSRGRVRDKFVFVARVAPIILLLAVGVFRDDLRAVVKDAQRIDTPYISLQFNRASEAKSKIWDEREALTTQTLFEAGVRAYLAVARAPLTDLDKITSFCNKENGIRCEFPQTHVDYIISDKKINDLRVNNDRLRDDLNGADISNNLHLFKNKYKLDDYLYFKVLSFLEENQNQNDDAESFLRSGNEFLDSLNFSFNIHKLSQCIKEFKERFPNGVPIIEEISEIAADYTMADIQGVDRVEDLPRYDRQIEIIVKRIIDGGRVATEEKRVSRGEAPSGTKCDISTDQKGLLREMLFVHFKYLWHEKKKPKGGDVEADVLPYRAIFDASTLLMAGHAVEAARYLDHKLVQFDKWKNAPSSELSFVDYLFRLQLLTHIDGLYEFAAKKQSVPLFRKQWPDRLARVMDHVSEWFSVNTNLNSFEIDDLLKSCARDKLNFNSLIGEENYENKQASKIYNESNNNKDMSLRRSFSGVSEKEISSMYEKYLEFNNIEKERDWGKLESSNYIKSMVHFYIEKYYTYLSALSNKENGITNIHIEKAIELLGISMEKSNNIFLCYREDRVKALKVRAVFAFVAGELFAFYAQQLQQEEVLQETLRSLKSSDSKSKEFACMADLALRFALKTNEDLESHIKSLPEPVVNPIEGEAARARTMLTKISLKQCDAFEAHRNFLKLAS